MDERRLEDLERRVDALEAELEAWRERTRQMLQRRYGSGSPAESGRGPVRRVSAPAAGDTWRRVVDAVTGEGAIGRIGIGLLLLGLVYAVQYGIDRGWITELVQVVLAAVLGLVLLSVGHRIRSGHPVLSRLLTGGGFGSLYVAVFAAQAVYGLVPFGFALALMSLVTLSCFLVGTSRQDAAMAVVAVMGGLATPFVIRSGDPDLPALVAYVSVVLATAGLLYWRHGWRSLLVWTSLAALPVIVMVLIYLNEPDVIPLAWRWSAQGALLVGVAIFSVLPLVRSGLESVRPAPEPPSWIREDLVPLVLPVLAVVVALAPWGMARAIWEMDDLGWSLAGAGVSLALAGGYVPLVRSGRRIESGAALFVLTWVVATTAIYVFEGGGLSAAAWGLLFLVLVRGATRHRVAGAGFAAATIVIGLFVWMPERLSETLGEHAPFMSWDALGDTITLAFVGLAALEPRNERLRMLMGALLWLAMLALAGREFTSAAATTISWSVLAVVLFAAGTRGRAFRMAGMVTVAVVVAKLLLFDLSQLDQLVRVGIFAGFGAVLLLVSYFFPSLWRGEDAHAESAVVESESDGGGTLAQMEVDSADPGVDTPTDPGP